MVVAYFTFEWTKYVIFESFSFELLMIRANGTRLFFIEPSGLERNSKRDPKNGHCWSRCVLACRNSEFGRVEVI